jgi:hypothetical protein
MSGMAWLCPLNELMSPYRKKNSKESTFLVAIDFSDSARDALPQAKLFLAEKPARIIALHVIDRDFITECIRHELGDEGQISFANRTFR